MNPEETLAHLKETTSGRTHRTLDAVFRACQELKAHKSQEFTYAMVARVGHSYGVPNVQSLHNKGGANYRVLIDSFAAQLLPKQKKATGPYSWIEQLPVSETKLLTKKLLAELKKAQSMIAELVPPNKVYEVDLRVAPSSQFKLNGSERRALEYLASEDFLNDRQLQKGPRGDVLGVNGEQLFKPGTLDALQKALKHL